MSRSLRSLANYSFDIGEYHEPVGLVFSYTSDVGMSVNTANQMSDIL